MSLPNRNVADIKNVESEAGVIATLCYHPEFSFYSEQLKPNHFSDEQNAYFYYGICELAKRGVETIDAYNLFNILNANAGRSDDHVILRQRENQGEINPWAAIEPGQISFRKDVVDCLSPVLVLCAEINVAVLRILRGSILDPICLRTEDKPKVVCLGEMVSLNITPLVAVLHSGDDSVPQRLCALCVILV
mgnify:CR=1 FL=1